jgi:hypothetical protein
MPTDPKPLFRPDAFRPKLAAFALPPAAAGARPKLGNWMSLLHSMAAEKMKETELLTSSATSSSCPEWTSTGLAGSYPNGHTYIFGRWGAL